MLTIIRRTFSLFLMVVILITSSVFSAQDERVNSVMSIEKITDGLYTMDYTYDYDIVRMLTDGVSSHVSLIFEAINNIFSGRNIRFGCSTFNSITADGEHLFSRNFDYMDADYMIVWTHPSNGYASISSVSLGFMGYDKEYTPDRLIDRAFALVAPYVPLDGINEKGLSIGVLELEKDPLFQVSGKTALTTTTMIRAVLDEAATVDEAIELFRRYDVRDFYFGGCTYHYQISDAQGNSVVIEFVDGDMKLIYPEERTDSPVKYQGATNFYLYEGVDDPDGVGQDRLETIFNALDAKKGVTSEQEAMDILQSVSMKDADLHGFICSTLWSVVYNQDDLTMNLCHNNDFDTIYSFSVAQPQVIQQKRTKNNIYSISEYMTAGEPIFKAAS